MTESTAPIERESMEVDVVIVGAGPAGLSAACRLMQLSKQHELNLSVVVLEKAAAVGDHILSGAVIEPTALRLSIKKPCYNSYPQTGGYCI
jgi:electron-transferring-flavoprotein dehydrogenase